MNKQENRIHGHEWAPVVGPPDAKWIYYVKVSRFTFVFFSLEVIKESSRPFTGTERIRDR